MAANGRPTFAKRQREIQRQNKKRDKAARRARRKAERDNTPPMHDGGEDPDIAGIIPGPQPLPWDDDEIDGYVP